ncbi:hypothetical protein V7O62_11005 [Methanolobus sp. ZRKC2]|uniref:COG1361 S-layer family protein n=1 Tax=Methanolobus sp. ZRKC2 TaxID=3125783 RepID=UPI0032441F2A
MIDFLKKYGTLLAIGLALLLMMTPAVHSKELLRPVSEFSTNYYEAYGEPDLYASLVGNSEFERGEEYLLNVVLSNRGVLHGMKYRQPVDFDEENLHAASLKELEYETFKTTAIGIKAELVSSSELIEVDSGMCLQTLDELVPGELPESPLVYKIEVSKYAPAGEYMLLLPVEYQYQNDVEMTDGGTAILGLPDIDHVVSYKNVNKTLMLPVYVKPAPRFEIVDVTGELQSGSSSIINVTYANAGEIPANDTVARIVVMKPLSSLKNEISIGTLYPGETRTVSFEIAGDFDAIPKDYALSSEIRYIDENDKTSLSESLIVDIPLEESGGAIPMQLFVYIGIVLTILYIVLRYVQRMK